MITAPFLPSPFQLIICLLWAYAEVFTQWCKAKINCHPQEPYASHNKICIFPGIVRLDDVPVSGGMPKTMRHWILSQGHRVKPLRQFIVCSRAPRCLPLYLPPTIPAYRPISHNGIPSNRAWKAYGSICFAATVEELHPYLQKNPNRFVCQINSINQLLRNTGKPLFPTLPAVEGAVWAANSDRGCAYKYN